MRNTQNQKKILALLRTEEKALSAADIHQKLPEMDLATVYRNLNKFVENDTIRELSIKKGESLFEINEDGHEHAVCANCGKIRHIKIDKKKLLKVIDLDDFDVDDIEITIKGSCK